MNVCNTVSSSVRPDTGMENDENGKSYGLILSEAKCLPALLAPVSRRTPQPVVNSNN